MALTQNASAGRTTGQVLESLLYRHDTPECFVGPQRSDSYSEVRSRLSQWLQAFRLQGISRTTSVRLLAENSLEMLYGITATILAETGGGALHPKGSLQDHSYVIGHSGADLLVFDPRRYEERARDLAAEHPGLRLLALGPSDVADDLIALSALQEPKDLRSVLLQRTLGDQAPRISYTGGTTGMPKGILRTYEQDISALSIELTEWDWPDATRTLVTTPLTHSGNSLVLTSLARGGSIHVTDGGHFDPKQFFQLIDSHRITVTMLVPTMIYAILDAEVPEGVDISSLETVFYGASPISPKRLAEGIERFGQIFCQFYGQSEAPMAICVMRKSEHLVSDPTRLSSCGRPVPWVTVQLQDESGEPVKQGCVGEICVRGPLVMGGYWRDDAETERTFAGGWLHTGDLAREEPDGFLSIVDRKKEMIISGGFNVYPSEIEHVLGAHDAVSSVAVIGVPDDRWGEAVTAVVVPKPGRTIDPDELKALVREAKGAVYAPKHIEVVTALPTSAVGKIDKKELRRKYWLHEERQVR